MKVATPFVFIGVEVTKQLTIKLNGFLLELYSGWFSEDKHFQFTVAQKNQQLYLDKKEWRFYGNSSDFWLAFKVNDDIKSKLLSSMFEVGLQQIPKSTKFMEHIFQDFIDSNLNALFALANSECLHNDDISSFKLAFGSGALTGNFSSGYISLQVAFGGELIKSICGEVNQNNRNLALLNELTDRSISVENYKAAIEVMAGKAEITIQDFARMEIGDTIVLDRRVEDPFFAQSLDSVFIAHAQLGKLENKKTIQLIE